MAAERSIARAAFAKINLDLRVRGVRPDGYHELDTTFQAIALADALTFKHAAGPFHIVCDDARCPTDRRNLVWRAAELVWKAARRRGAPRDAIVTIAKRIPIQGGLGGGSSDAAAALSALASLWRVRLTRRQLHRIARTLGADVPYFLEGGTMRGRARGDRLFRLPDRPRAWVVLVVPAFGVSTKEAFEWWDDDGQGRRDGRDSDGQDRQDRQDRQDGKARKVGRAGRETAGNDLEEVVARRHPIINKLVAALKREGAFRAALSGSGSAVFGLFRRKIDAERAAGALAGRRRQALLTRTIGRLEYRRLAAK